MSGLLRRVPYLATVLFVFAFVGSDAQASYLFRLTEQEIVDIMDHYYPKGGYDRELVLRQMSEPFDCRNFDGLCGEVGDEYAQLIVGEAWSRARRRMPIESIGRIVLDQVDDYGLRWIERRFPDGIPEKDEYWGVFSDFGTPTECTDKVTVNDGDFRVVQASFRVTIGFYVWGRIKAEHYKRNVLGKYKSKDVDQLEVSGRVIIQEASFNPVETQVFKIKQNASRISAGASEGGLTLVKVHFVEGCGGDSNNSALFACTCWGELPFGF